VSGLGTGVATALAVNVGSAGAPLVNGGVLGTPSSGTVTNLTGTASININGTVGATTASTGAFTTLSATGVTTVQAGSAAAPAITTSGDTNTGIFFPAADTIAFTEGGVESMRIDSSGNLCIGVTPNGGGGVLQLKSGITFPATQVASSDVNTLDDYETGSFTPTAVGSTTAGTATYSVASGKYTKIGNRVFYNLRVVYTAGTGTGNMRVGGLPFAASASTVGSTASIYAENLAGTALYIFVPLISPNNTYISIDQTPTGGGGAIATTYDGAADIQISGHYAV
jgi:hypothetical protein